MEIEYTSAIFGETIEVHFEDIVEDNASCVYIEAPIVSRLFVPARKNEGGIRFGMEVSRERRSPNYL